MKDKRKISRRKIDTLPVLVQESLNEFKREIMERMDKQDEKIQPLLDAFRGMNWSKTALVWIVSLTGSIVALILGIRQISK